MKASARIGTFSRREMEEEGEKEETEEQHDAPGPLLQRGCIAVIQPEKAKANDVTELFLPEKIIEQKLRDDRAEQRELAPKIDRSARRRRIARLPNWSPLIFKGAAGEGKTYTSRIPFRMLSQQPPRLRRQKEESETVASGMINAL
jgi:hypothetical protein